MISLCTLKAYEEEEEAFFARRDSRPDYVAAFINAWSRYVISLRSVSGHYKTAKRLMSWTDRQPRQV